MGLISDRLEISIDRLLFKGFEPAGSHRIGKAVENELARLFSDDGTPASLMKSKEIPHLSSGTLEMSPSLGPSEIGARIAQRVYGGLNR